LFLLVASIASGGPAGGLPFEKADKQVFKEPAFKVAHLAAGGFFLR